MFELVTVIAEFKVVTPRLPTPVMFELDTVIAEFKMFRSRLPTPVIFELDTVIAEFKVFTPRLPTPVMFEVDTVIAEFKVFTPRLLTPVMFEVDTFIESLIELTKSLPVEIKFVETLLKVASPVLTNALIGRSLIDEIKADPVENQLPYMLETVNDEIEAVFAFRLLSFARIGLH